MDKRGLFDYRGFFILSIINIIVQGLFKLYITLILNIEHDVKDT